MQRFLAGLGLGVAAGLAVGVGLAQTLLAPRPAPMAGTPVGPVAVMPAGEHTETASADAGDGAPRPPRGRVVRPDPVPRPERPDAQERPEPGDEPPPTVEELTAIVRRALAGERSFVEARAVAKRFRKAPSGDPVPLDLVLEVLAGIEDADGLASRRGYVAETLAAHVAPDVAVDALLAALRATGAEGRRLLLVAYQLAERAILAERGELLAIAEGLLGEPDADCRWAGLLVAGALRPPPVAALSRVASSDPDADLRDAARSLLVTSDDPAARAAGTPLVTSSALSGTLDERQEAIWMLSDLGAEGADAALALLVEGGLGPDERDAAVWAILAAGRVQELFAASSEPETQRAAAEWLASEEVGAEVVEALLPHVDALLDAVDPDTGREILWELASHDRHDAVARVALRDDAPTRLRTAAVSVLADGTGADEEGISTEAQRRAVEIVRRLLQPAVRTTVRRAVVDLVWEGEWAFDDPTTRAHLEVTLRRTAAGDPNAWVRLVAREALDDLLDLDE